MNNRELLLIHISNKTIKTVYFPNGNHNEASACHITFTDGHVYRTISDTAYMIAEHLKMNDDHRSQVGL